MNYIEQLSKKEILNLLDKIGFKYYINASDNEYVRDTTIKVKNGELYVRAFSYQADGFGERDSAELKCNSYSIYLNENSNKTSTTNFYKFMQEKFGEAYVIDAKQYIQRVKDIAQNLSDEFHSSL